MFMKIRVLALLPLLAAGTLLTPLSRGEAWQENHRPALVFKE
jgi:hypothetical protein